jgi:hypothetical protein
MNCLLKYHCHDDLVQPLLTTFKRCSRKKRKKQIRTHTELQNIKIKKKNSR